MKAICLLIMLHFIMMTLASANLYKSPIFDQEICRNLKIIRNRETDLNVAVDMYGEDKPLKYMKKVKNYMPSMEEMYIWVKDPYAMRIVTLKVLILGGCGTLTLLILYIIPVTRSYGGRGFVITVWLVAYLIQILLSFIIFIFNQIKKLVILIASIVTFERVMGLLGSKQRRD